MNQYRSRIPLFLFAICIDVMFRVSPAFSEQVIIDSAGQFDFARACMERGDYEMAVGEFERFIHFFPDDPLVPSSRRLMGICHMKTRRFDAAREIFFKILDSETDATEAGKTLLFIGESYYEQGIPMAAEHHFDRIIERCPHLDLKDAAFYRLGWTRMQSGNWNGASEAFGSVGKNSVFYNSALELVGQSLQGEELPYKSPARAGTLAAVIPGLGHAYLSRYRDATVAFLLNAVFIWAAVESFNEDHNALGGILTFLEVGWYSGNIYSAVNCTHKHNRKLQDDFRNSLTDPFDLRLFAAAKGRVGLVLTFHF